MLFSENQTKDIKPVYVYVYVYVLNNYSGDGGVEEVHAHDASHPPLELTGGFDCIK